MSGSDTGDRRTTRMELAKEGAIQAVETLQDGDQVGVVAFDYTPRWITEVRTIRGARTSAPWPTASAPSSRTGHGHLQRPTTPTGACSRSRPGQAHHPAHRRRAGSPAPFVPLINAMRRAGITLSTVGVSGDIGSRAQADMQDWPGGGRGATTTPTTPVMCPAS